MTEETRGCVYELSPEGIHQFTFTGKSEGGMDEFFDALTTILTTAPPDTLVLRYIVRLADSGSQTAVNELVKRFRKLEIALPQRPRGRTVILHKGDVMLTLMNTFLGVLAPQRDKTRFFKYTQLPEAIRWVLSDD